MAGPTTKADKLMALHETYGERLPERIDEIERACRIWDADRANDDKLRAVRYLAHGLAGAAAGFGYAAVTAVARDMERRVDAVFAEEARDVRGELVAALDERIAALREAATRGGRVRTPTQ